MFLAGGALSCVTTSINPTIQAMCKEPGMDGSDLMQGGKPGQLELVDCVVSSMKGWKAAQQSHGQCRAGNGPPACGPGHRGLQGALGPSRVST